MTTTMMREYPQLPVLPMNLSLRAIKAAKIGPTTMAALTGLSRVAVNRWLLGDIKNPNKTSIEAVSTLAYKVLRALKHKHLPLQKSRRITATDWDILRDSIYETPLVDTPPQDLLPKAWIEQLNLPREQHEPESVL